MLYELRDNKQVKLWYLLVGLISGLATLTHFTGVIFFIAIFADIILGKKGKVSGLLAGFSLPIIVWLISMYPNYPIFLEQLSLQAQFRQVIKTYILFIMQQDQLETKVILLIYIVLSTITTGIIFKLKRFYYLAIGLWLAWIVYLAGELGWYMIYIVPFIYILSSLSSYHLLSNEKNYKFLSFFLVILLSTLLLLHTKSHLKQLAEYDQYQDSYNRLIHKIKSHIPFGRVIYLSSIPDLYFDLKNNYQLYEFPNLLPKKNKYIEILDKSDFIVINFHLEKMLVGELLIGYIALNTTEEFVFLELGDDNLSVIKLKPRNERVEP